MPYRRRALRRHKALLRQKKRVLFTWLLGASLAAVWSASVSVAHADERFIASLETPEATLGLGASAKIVGPASVIDGDTITIAGQEIELAGIDAPEMEQTCKVIIFSWPCGEDASKFLSALVAERDVSCEEVGRDDADRRYAICSTDAVQLNETLVRIGMALATPDSGAAFGDDENAAREREVGVWRSRFDPPWEWRADNSDDEDDAEPPVIRKIRR